MLPPHRQDTLVDSGEFNSGRVAFRGIPVAWDDEYDDDEDEQETNMITVPRAAPSSQSMLRVLPPVPDLRTPPPPPRFTVPSAPFLPCVDVEAECEPHWVPDPPPPRESLPSAESWTDVGPQPDLEPEREIVVPYYFQHVPEWEPSPQVAITLATPRTQAKLRKARRSISRKVVLPWPALVMVAAIAGGVVFEHAQRGDIWPSIYALAGVR